MPRITSHKLSKGEFDYELQLGLDDAPLMQNALEIELVAVRRKRGSTDEDQVSAKVSVNLESMQAEVTVGSGSMPIGKIDLAELDIPEELVGEDAWNRLRVAWEQFAGTVPLDEALQAIPVPDPVLGCLLKAGLTATLGQTMRCYHEVKGTGGAFRLARRIAVCLAENGIGILWTATKRALRCMIMLGAA